MKDNRTSGAQGSVLLPDLGVKTVHIYGDIQSGTLAQASEYSGCYIDSVKAHPNIIKNGLETTPSNRRKEEEKS